MYTNPKQITSLSPFAGSMVETFFVGFSISFAIITFNSTRKSLIRFLLVYFIGFLGLQLGLDIYSSWKIEHRNHGEVVTGFGEVVTIEEPIGIRTLCALTAALIFPVHLFYLTLMMKSNISQFLLVPTALCGFVTFLTGVAASISRVGSNDPGWATNDDGNAFTLQCAFYAALFLTDSLISFALLRVWTKGQKSHISRIFAHLNKLPFLPGIMACSLIFVVGICEDRSVQLSILMPLGSIHVSLFLFYIVKKGNQESSNEQQAPSGQQDKKMEPVKCTISKPKATMNRVRPRHSVVNITRETCIDSRSFKEPFDTQRKSRERILLESSTPSFLRTDPYTLGNRSMSLTSLSLSRQASRENTLYEFNNSSKHSLASYKESKISLPLNEKSRLSNNRKRQQTGGSSNSVKFQLSDSSNSSQDVLSNKVQKSCTDDEGQVLETHIICDMITTSPVHSSPSSSSHASIEVDGKAY